MTTDELIAHTCARFNTVAGEAAPIPSSFSLFEVRSDGVMRQFEPNEAAVVSKLSLNGRLFLKRNGSDEKLEPFQFTIKGDSPLLEMDTDEVARLMTLLDHELMCRIDPLEYIWHIYKTPAKNTANLNNFSNRFNQVRKKVVF